MSDLVVQVAIPLPLDRLYSYRLPAEMAPSSPRGRRVLVPFGKRRLVGVIVSLSEGYDGELKRVIALLDDGEPTLSPHLLEFLVWLSGYYRAPLGEVVKGAIPKLLLSVPLSDREGGAGGAGRGIRVERSVRLTAPSVVPTGRKMAQILELLEREGEMTVAELSRRLGAIREPLQRLVSRGAVIVTERELYRDPFANVPIDPDTPRILNNPQRIALQEVVAAMDAGGFHPFLLHGVTGSGKTEVYLQAISHARSKGKGALVLVPEISLTPLLVKRFRDRFGRGVAVLHSSLGDGERYDEWRRIKRKEADIVIGVRSAIFAPLDDIGVIVVDEEHDGSYKQSEGVRYNARDMALVRGRIAGSVVILGSATPSITTRYAAETGKLTLLTLPHRAVGSGMPDVTVVSLEGKRDLLLSEELVTAMEEQLARGGQTLLFLNRRGFSPWVVCDACKTVLSCPNCSVTLTYHRSRRRAICHYCDHSIPFPPLCSACGSGDFTLLGKGTERVEDELSRLFPSARIARLDRDTTSRKGSHADILDAVEKREIDILVGTQMVAKGHDFPGVTLVGVISADDSLHVPDLWSAERTFQLLTQVLGRSGRGESPGRVIIQTSRPDHYAVSAALSHDYDRFYREELSYRQEAGYPPFARLALLLFSSNSEKKVESAASAALELLREVTRERNLRLEILGPAIPPLAIVRGRHRRHILLKSGSVSTLKALFNEFNRLPPIPPSVRMSIDVDPLDMI